MSVTAYIALGSNLGDRQGYLNAGIDALKNRPDIRVVKVSRFWETPPVGGPAGQGPYLNAAACLDTDLYPRQLLEVLLSIEQQLGRIRAERYGPRTIDLDLLLYGEEIISEPGLDVPHPRMHERSFMLGPLAEIAPTARHPGLNKSVVELLAALPGPASRGPGLGEGSLTGQRALVTGSSSGIGRAITLALAQSGADVLIHARQSVVGAKEVMAEVRELGGRSQVLMADFSDPAAYRWLIDQAWEILGGVDIWINNAGADTLTGDAAKLPFDFKLHDLLTVDVTATIMISREVGRRMKEAGHGVILNMGWDQAETGMEGDSGQLFAATKGAVMAFTKSLALTLAPEVRVNCLAPGWIRTAWGEAASEAWQQRAIRETPLARWGTPEDVAAVARWLVSPDSDFVTGQVIRINGGAVR